MAHVLGFTDVDGGVTARRERGTDDLEQTFRMKNHLGWKLERHRRRVRLGDGHHFFRRIAAEVGRGPASFRDRLDGEMAGFVE